MSDNSVLRNHLESEVNKLHGQRRMGLIIGLILAVVVLLYMAWIDRQVTYWSQPDNLVLTASGVVESNLPSMKRSARAMIRTEAPKLARYVGDTVSREVPVLVRNMVEETVAQYTRKLARFAVDKYSESFAAVIEGARGDIQQAVTTDVNAERDRFVVLALEKQLETAIQNVSKGKLSEDPVFVKLEESHVALANLNKRLAKMASNKDKDLGRRDQLTKRFLGTFWRYVQQENPDARAANEPAGNAGKKGKK